MRRRLLVVSVAALVIASIPRVVRSGEAPTTAAPTKVIVVGTQHFLTDMPDGFTPGHLRALLAKFAPDVLAVEAPANLPDPWPFAPYELARVTRPWADARGVPVTPCDWHDAAYQVQLGQMIAGIRAGGHGAELQEAESELQAASSRQPLTFAFVNSGEYYKLWRGYHAALQELCERPTPWQTRNEKIVSNVVELAKTYSGQRVAVVFGAAHSYYLIDQLRLQHDVELVPVSQYLPITEAEVSQHTLPTDYLQALRLLNFGMVAPAQLTRCEAFLEQAKQFPELVGDCLLFGGKLLLHKRRPAEAFGLFEELAKRDSDEISQFDNSSKLAEAGRVYSAIALSQHGDHAAAREKLHAILGDSSVTPVTRQWAEQLVATLSADAATP